MNTHKVTPKDFFLWAGAMVALYWSIGAFLALIFAYIDQAFPDALDASQYSYDPFSASIRFAMASLIVLVPITVLLLNLIRRDIIKEHGKADIWVRRWAIYLTLFIAGVAMAVDLITLINYFLGGEVTIRFMLKVATVLLVAAAVFMHFLADYWGYWVKFPKRARSVGIAAGVLVIATIASGFILIGSPAQIRLQRLDSQKVSDLQNIQYQVTNFYQTKGRLPETLAELNDPLSGQIVPKDAQTGQEYGYRVTKAPYSFEVCATFNTATDKVTPAQASEAMHYGMSDTDLNWQHSASQTCYERTIDPERYPLFPKSVPEKI